MKQFKKEVRSRSVCAQGTHSLGRERDGDSWEELSIDSVVGKKEDAAEVVSRGYRKGFLSHLWEAQRDIKFITLTGCSGVISSGPGVRGKS